MLIFILAICLLVLSGFGAFFSKRVAIVGAVIASLINIGVASYALFGKTLTLNLKWNVPLGSFRFEIDGLSAIFILLISVLGPLIAIYGAKYLTHLAKSSVKEKSSYLFFNLLIASMLSIVVARNGIFFLLSWEIMSFASFFLLTYEDEREKTRKAGFYYLIATQIGTSFLLLFFLGLSNGKSLLDFPVTTMAASTPLFLLALFGFGVKAGVVPLHVWLPEAHPAAPSHISAIMSALMIKMGVYGILRFLMLVEPMPSWGFLLMAVGMISSLFGILFASYESDLKRLLAYSSIENIGIILIGIGLGVLGESLKSPLLFVLGFGGALFHLCSHAFAKTLLFLVSGAVLQQTHTRQLDELGGLLKKMRGSALVFCIASLSLAALFPLNSFISEFLLYRGFLEGMLGEKSLFFIALFVMLAFVGVFASVTFAKAFGIAFLGEARSDKSAHASEVEKTMLFPMKIGAIFSLLIFAASPFILPFLVSVLKHPFAESDFIVAVKSAQQYMFYLLLFAAVLFLLILLFYLVRKGLLKKREIRISVTWGCGYDMVSSRMQYSASSFVQPLRENFRKVLWPSIYLLKPQGIFPKEGKFSSKNVGVFLPRFYTPLFDFFYKLALKMRWIQQGRVQIYILYIFLTILILLVGSFW